MFAIFWSDGSHTELHTAIKIAQQWVKKTQPKKISLNVFLLKAFRVPSHFSVLELLSDFIYQRIYHPSTNGRMFFLKVLKYINLADSTRHPYCVGTLLGAGDVVTCSKPALTAVCCSRSSETFCQEASVCTKCLSLK